MGYSAAAAPAKKRASELGKKPAIQMDGGLIADGWVIANMI